MRLSIVQWAGQGQQRTAVDWTLLTDADMSLRFAVTMPLGECSPWYQSWACAGDRPTHAIVTMAAPAS